MIIFRDKCNMWVGKEHGGNVTSFVIREMQVKSTVQATSSHPPELLAGEVSERTWRNQDFLCCCGVI